MTSMAAPRGLSPDDIDTIRAGLAAGRRPKVVFTAAAGQIAGQTGQVVALGQPSDAEWISVRFGKDKLDFSPTDLQLPGKTGPRKKTRAAPTTPTTPTATRAGAAASEAPAAPAQPSAPAARRAPEPPAVAATAPADPSAPAAKPARRGRGKTPAELSVTLTWTDGDWSVQAHRGAKVVAKPTPVRAADALRMVEMLEAPAVADAVAEIVNTARAEAADRADQLRRELAAVEARLAELPDLG